MSQQITVEFDADGNAKVEAFGYRGGACEVATKAIREALGETVSNAKKPEASLPVQADTKKEAKR